MSLRPTVPKTEEWLETVCLDGHPSATAGFHRGTVDQRPGPLMKGVPPGCTMRLTDAMTTLAGLRVLLVDDEADCLDVTSVSLRSQGALVTAATGATVALAVLLRAPFDLLISDIEMPEYDGYWLIRRVRELPSKHGGNILAVALTAHASEATRELVVAAGYSLRIAKPVDPEVLWAELQALLPPLGPTR